MGLMSAYTRKQHDNQQSLPSTSLNSSIRAVLHLFTHEPSITEMTVQDLCST